ncbi:HAMP domain-containing histidine kinase [Bradyrhizobium sp. BRP22]|uniref:ATP-binding protein n=1 Tax=Bradyrhizobium sp. BRP22 TaxID=2793821 RepID=UPI001CD7A7FB|nr:ATP-binding protein [Bradyrhizobium sp. BRP22]MCA1455511.1 HAMP domain-containing histidine kinase [Bradyrhizobium sp. BRP22]
MLERISDQHDHGKTADEAMTPPARAGAGTGSVALDAPTSTDDTTNRKNMALLIQLRWTAVIGQIATIAFVEQWLGIALPILPMAGVIAALVALNLLSLVWVRYRAEINNRELLLALMLDVTALTGQLYLSGGATNPFTSLYLLQVTLGAVLLDARSTWSLVALACLSFAGLTMAYRPLGLPHHGFSDPFSLHVAGMFVGFMLDAILLVVFVTRINRNLRERDANLAALRQHAAEQDHIVRMGLLASGAAHELGTPLASLSVILSDWRRMPALTSDPELSDDLAEMETSLQRCKSIVTGILVSAGEARGEESSPTTVTAFLTALVEEWRTTRPSATLYFRNEFGADLPVVSEVALKQAIFNVLDNSAEVSRDWIELAAERAGDKLLLSVTDRGPGFAPEMLAQLGKPYQSSKGRPGSGLGLFLVVNVVRKLGGVVTARNNAEGGATISLELPLATLAIGGSLGG